MRVCVFTGHFFDTISLVLVTLISIDRYIATIHPYFYAASNKVLKTTITLLLIFTLMVLSFIMMTKWHDVLVSIETICILVILVFIVFMHIRINNTAKGIDESYRKRIGSRFQTTLPFSAQRKRAFSRFLFVASLYVNYIPYTITGLAFQLKNVDENILYVFPLWSYVIIDTKSLVNSALYIISLKRIRTQLVKTWKKMMNII